MNKKLSGILFLRNGESLDYCYIESIRSMIPVCDVVYVLDAGSDDKTFAYILETFQSENKVRLIRCTEQEWHEQKGKEKLSYFTNKAIERAESEGYDYVLNIQADEILSETSYHSIKEAISTGEVGFMCSRINLWDDPYHYLSVQTDRQPCSTQIIRLAKSNYRSVDDAESIGVSNVNFNFVNKIKIWHMGFVRDKKIMKDKVIHMQEEVFGVDHDKKLDGTDIFESDRWFSGDDLKIIEEPLPDVIKKWAAERYEINKKYKNEGTNNAIA